MYDGSINEKGSLYEIIMKNYIVFDLEWNQSACGKSASIENLPFEIIEIGAVRLDEHFTIQGEFHRLIRPQIYTQMHYAISEVTHMSMGELQHHGELIQDAAQSFFDWCGDAPVYCTWGSMDLTELQRNLHFFSVENPFPYPLFYYDVQKLYGLFCKEGTRTSLDSAVCDLHLTEERPFHRALDDAYYTSRVFARIHAEYGNQGLLRYQSVDYYRLPVNKKDEIHMIFPDYSKYVSRPYPSREDALKERTVTEMRCYACGRLLRKKIRWFSPNQKIYYALAICPEHGFLKGKIRIKKLSDPEIFVIKTLKLTDEEGAASIRQRKEDLRRRHSRRTKAKAD